MTTRSINIGMPQMALGCLSENWLLKELGSLHWDTLCAALRGKSNDLSDSQGRRLYATFVRVRLEFDDTIAAFGEGDDLNLDLDLSRFGRSTVQSTIGIRSKASTGRAMLLSTFSYRTQANNTSLAKSEPAGDYDPSILAMVEPPPFFQEYSDVRRQHGRSKSQAQPVHAYRINPFTDSNGANLLYFASYQVIHDFLTADPALHTKSRDLCYFRNSELTDHIHNAAVNEPVVSGPRIARSDVLFRNSDGESIAYVTSVKEHV